MSVPRRVVILQVALVGVRDSLSVISSKSGGRGKSENGESTFQFSEEAVKPNPKARSRLNCPVATTVNFI
jgi:hypothetical protein